MNLHCHRLVFSSRLGQPVAVAETARGHGRGTTRSVRRGQGRVEAAPLRAALALALAAAFTAPDHAVAQTPSAARPPVSFASRLAAPASPLPQPYGSTKRVDGSFVNDPKLRSFFDPALKLRGVDWVVDGHTATFKQGDVDRIVLNWDSFDIGAGYSVKFEQNPDPQRAVSALNRIWSADPSKILGTLTANREIILVNTNGVYFGAEARVDTGRFVASALGVADAVFEKGLRSITDGTPVFSSVGTDHLPTQLVDGDGTISAAVSVEAGAVLRSAAGGDVLLVAPRVLNQGRIETPGGQAVLAAGDKVYLMSSADPAQRGLIVAVDPVRLADGSIDHTLGTVENRSAAADAATTAMVDRLNEIRAERGSVNLVGLTVRQNGAVNATTAVKGANGSIQLQAMDGTVALAGGTQATAPASRRGLAVQAGALARVGSSGGTVELGAGSVTAVLPEASAATQVDAEVFNPSRIRVEGELIGVAGGAQLRAPGGQIDLLAASNRASSPLFDDALVTQPAQADASRIVVAPDAVVDAAGLRDVAIDGARNQGAQRLFRIELADAPVQRSGPLYRSELFFDLREAARIKVANLSGAAASVGRTAQERASSGGSIRLQTEGALVVGEGARLDVSGGSLAYGATTLQSSIGLRGDRAFQIAAAAAGNRIDSLAELPRSVAVPAYTEGQDAGTLQLGARRLALAGTLAGGVVQGALQMDGSLTAARAGTLQVGRETGVDFDLPALAVVAVPVTDAALGLDAGFFADPLAAALPTVTASAGLSAQHLGGAAGFGTLRLRAADVAIGTDTAFPLALDLGSGGVLDVRASRITLDAALRAAGGQVSLATTLTGLAPGTDGLGDIRLSGASRLDVAGLWTNLSQDTPSTRPAQDAGGSITLAAGHALTAGPGALLDVSGGATLTAAGTLRSGKAGSLALRAGRNLDQPGWLQLDGVTLRGFDFGSGGALTLGSQALQIGGDGAPSDATLFRPDPDWFTRAGFGRIELLAFGDATVRSGTTLAPSLLNWSLRPSARLAGGDLMDAVATPLAVDTTLAARAPVSLTLAAEAPLLSGLPGAGASVIVERGAGITLEPGAALALRASRDITIGAGADEGSATLQAPGGSIGLTLTGQRGAAAATSAGDDPAGYLPGQAIWLGSGARLSVAGTAQLRSERLDGAATGAGAGSERQVGTVLGGGQLSLVAQRGHVVAEAGSQISLDGTQALVHQAGLAAPVNVARAAGTLRISSPEGIVLDGSVSAQPPRDAQGRALADGGRLQLDLGTGGINSFTAGTPYPVAADGRPAPRQSVVDEVASVLGVSGLQPGDSLTALGNGTALLPLRLLRDAGFDGLRLGAGDRIRFDADLTLTMPLGITLDTPALVAGRPAVQVALGGSQVVLGDHSINRLGAAPDRSVAPADAGSDATLTLRAPTISLVGHSALQGFVSSLLAAGDAANGEIRLAALDPGRNDGSGNHVGSLAFAGDLQLMATRIWATSGSVFDITGLAASGAADAGSRLLLRTGVAGASSAVPLSAFGSLNLAATTIDHDGVLMQPFGAITLTAGRDLVLGAHSLTSVAGPDPRLGLLYGETQNLSQWLLPNGLFATALPVAKGITLQALQVHTDPAARIDARGGGDVRAWEFFAGVGGSQDALAVTDAWAVLPQQVRGQALALDGKLAAQARQLVITQAGSALPPGAYTLLPARYALQGEVIVNDPVTGREKVVNSAVLVRLAADQTGAATARPLVQDDGSTVVGGYLRAAGSVHADATPARWVIEPAATWQARSDQRVTSVTTLLGGSTSGVAVPRDAGRVTLQLDGAGSTPFTAQLALGGQGGRAGELDVAATRLVLADDTAAAAAAGDADALVLQAQALRDSAAGSVLLGGRRSSLAAAADGIQRIAIDASATQSVQVALDPARPLALDELVLASAGALEIAAGSRLQAADGAGATPTPRTLQLSGDGALAGVSTRALQVQRSGASLDAAAGALVLGGGAVLAGRSVALDATAALQLDPGATLQAAALDLAARRLVVGDGLATGSLDGATRLAGALLATARQADALTLRGYASIDFTGRQDWAGRGGDASAAPANLATTLVLDTPLLRGLPGADGTPAQVDLAARSVLLRNTSGRNADATAQAAGSGTLALEALPPLRFGQTGGLTLGPGQLGLGFGDVLLRSSGDLVLAGSGGISAQGDVSLRSARMTAATGADQVLRAAGTLALAAEPGARTLGETAGLGARVELAADQILQDGRIDLPAGQLLLRAAGSALDAGAPALRFGAGAVTSVAGKALLGDLGQPAWVQPGALQATATAGRIDLLGTLDASAAASAAATVDGGAISLQAAGNGGNLVVDAAARLLGGGSRSDGADAPLGGRLAVDVTTLAAGGLDGLATAAAAGGLTQAFSLRQRRGDLSLDTRLQAQRVTLAADAGALTLGERAGLVADAPGGGVVALAAGQDLRLADGASILARGTRTTAADGLGSNGGDVLLSSSRGRIGLAAGARIDASGDAPDDGRIVLRALRGADNASVQVDRFDAAQLRAGEVDIEAVKVFSQLGTGASTVAISRIASGNSSSTGGVGTLGLTSLRDDSTAFMRNAGTVLAGLGLDTSAVHLRAGVEVRASGDLTLASDWALNADRPGGDAGFLTLRAAGNLNLASSLSDGFASALATAALNDNVRSWSLRLAAGADLGAALPTAVRPAAADADVTPASGNLSITAGRLVRTGAGSIDLAAAGDIRFGAGTASTAPGQVYIAGRKADELPGLLQGLFAQHAAKPTFTSQGGRLTVEAGHDITAGESTQLVNNWLWRSGLESTNAAEAGLFSAVNHLAWWTEFSRFRQTLGAFGGGALQVSAGLDIVNLQATLADAGWANSRVMADAGLHVLGGGDLQVLAGRDVRGGQYLVAGGVGRVDAGGAVAAAAGNAQIAAPVLAQMDGARWQVQARQGLALAASFNPTAAPPSSADGRTNVAGFFYTWGDGAALALRSAAGELSLAGGIGASQIAALGLVGGAVAPSYFRVLPAALDLTAAGGTLRLLPGENTGAVLFPAADGLLSAWAGADLVLGSSSTTPNLALADSDPAAWPSARTPMARTSGLITGTDGLVATTLAGTAENLALRGADARPITLHAGGDITMTGDATLILPKASLVSAGGDILNLRISGQNLAADDVSTVSAGRDVLAGQLGELRWAGPGLLTLDAGRSIDLGNSAGISTTGNQTNARLPLQGAAVRLSAATATSVDLAVLDAAYLSEGANALWQRHRDALRDFVRTALASPALDYAQARAQFTGFPAAAQRRLAQQLLAVEFGARYLESPAPTATAFVAALRQAWQLRLADIVAGADAALAAGDDAAVLVLPGREELRGGAAIRSYIAQLRSLDFDRVDTDAAAKARSLQLASVQIGWRNVVAQSLGSTAAALDALLAASPQDPQALAWQAGLAQRSGRLFDDYRREVLAAEIQGAGDAAAGYGRATLPARLALFDQAAAAAELAGLGSVVAQPIWQGQAPLLVASGALNLTQSAVVTERGGAIDLINPGGAINVGLKQSDAANAKGVIALGGGDILGLARDDFQVNTQRVFIVGSGNMTLWSFAGDIDSGRGANTEVAAPPLAARRTADGVVFEVPATTTGSGLGILPDVAGNSSGTIGLYPAFGEILALDALIRAPRVVAASSVRGGDNLVQTGGGSAAPVAPPPPAVTPPPTQAAAARTEAAGAEASQRQRNSLLTVDLLGLGEAAADADCSAADEQAGKCRRRPAAATPAAAPATTPATPPTRSP